MFNNPNWSIISPVKLCPKSPNASIDDTLILPKAILLNTTIVTPKAPPRYKYHVCLLEKSFSRKHKAMAVIKTNPVIWIMIVAEYTPYCCVRPPLKATITDINKPDNNASK